MTHLPCPLSSHTEAIVSPSPYTKNCMTPPCHTGSASTRTATRRNATQRNATRTQPRIFSGRENQATGMRAARDEQRLGFISDWGEIRLRCDWGEIRLRCDGSTNRFRIYFHACSWIAVRACVCCGVDTDVVRLGVVVLRGWGMGMGMYACKCVWSIHMVSDFPCWLCTVRNKAGSTVLQGISMGMDVCGCAARSLAGLFI